MAKKGFDASKMEMHYEMNLPDMTDEKGGIYVVQEYTYNGGEPKIRVVRQSPTSNYEKTVVQGLEEETFVALVIALGKINLADMRYDPAHNKVNDDDLPPDEDE